MTAGGHSFSFWGLGWWMCGANLGHCNGSTINSPVLSEIEWEDSHVCLCECIVYVCAFNDEFCRKYLHPLGTYILFIFLFFHLYPLCTQFFNAWSQVFRNDCPPMCVSLCLYVYAAWLGKGYRITAVFCLWEVLLRSFPFVVPTDLSFCSGAFWEATQGTFCISLLWQIVTNCQRYINRLCRIWEMPGAQSIEANWQEKCFFKIQPRLDVLGWSKRQTNSQ